jgi:simple sugar transport system permease protein
LSGEYSPLGTLFSGTMLAGTSVLYATLGETIAERSGVINLGLEGVMMVSAMVAVMATAASGEPLIGVLAAIAVGAAMGLVHALLSVTLACNQIAAGLALFLLGKGLSNYLGESLVGVKVAGLAALPAIGDLLVPVSWLLVAAAGLATYRTKVGIALQAAGEGPREAERLGVDVRRVRFVAVLLGSALAGIGGAHLALGYAGSWTPDMVGGRGWVAIAMVILARWNPSWSFAGAYLFGAMSTLSFALQARGVHLSSYLLSMLPYVVTIVALVAASWNIRKHSAPVPKALAQPYPKE